MKIIYDNIDYFMSVDLTTWLSARGKVIGDIDAAIILAKVDSTDADADAVFTAEIASGITVSGNFLLVEADATDFGVDKLEIDGSYGLFLGVQFTGDAKYREIILDDNVLEVKQDGIRA